MTKNEAKEQGTTAGLAFADTFTKDQLLGEFEAQAENVRQAAASSAVTRGGFRSVDSQMAQPYMEAFATAARKRFYDRAGELPEVQAARRRQSLEWALDMAVSGCKDDLDKFRANLDKDPCYAFEWADRAMEAAAKLDVASRLRAVLEHPEGGVDAVYAEARKEALRGARYPSRSTSQPSNLMAQYKAAAYAEFAGRE